jgi:ribonuclease HI
VKEEIVKIWTDGASKGNPGPGGWGAYLQYGSHTKKLCGGELNTTNNRMELLGPINALKILKRPCKIILYTDSRYVEQGMTSWVYGWMKKGWKTSDNKPVKNEALWKELYELSKKHEIEWSWVKGHDGNDGNEIADALANKGVEELLYDKFESQ